MHIYTIITCALLRARSYFIWEKSWPSGVAAVPVFKFFKLDFGPLFVNVDWGAVAAVGAYALVSDCSP